MNYMYRGFFLSRYQMNCSESPVLTKNTAAQLQTIEVNDLQKNGNYTNLNISHLFTSSDSSFSLTRHLHRAYNRNKLTTFICFMLELKSVFAPDGLLSRHIPGYRARDQQLEMAQAIANTIERNGLLVAEAGTGTGKTFAYLAPALLAGGKVIISTGTKTLQDQLFNRDIPSV